MSERKVYKLLSDIPGYDEGVKLIMEFFPQAVVAHSWMQAVNPLLGNTRPLDMLLVGRKDKLIEFIKTSLSENKRPKKV